MTPAERARLIDQCEFEAECHAARQRAFQHVEQRRLADRERIRHWIGTPPPPTPIRPHLTRRDRCKLYHHNGQSKTLTEWASIAGVSNYTFADRLRSGMSFEQAITMSHGERAVRKHTVDGVSKTLAEWADHIGIRYSTLIKRMHSGRTLAEAIAMPKGLNTRGVASNFEASLGTGAGGTAQEIAEITFSNQEYGE